MTTLNIYSKSEDSRARILSNFHPSPFFLDGIKFVSVEGFIQGIKYPENHPDREVAFGKHGYDAKKMGHRAEGVFVYWSGQKIAYGSKEHHALIERAIRAKVEQNSLVRDALVGTKGYKLTHETGIPESALTSLPAKVFVDILTAIRDELLGKSPD